MRSIIALLMINNYGYIIYVVSCLAYGHMVKTQYT